MNTTVASNLSDQAAKDDSKKHYTLPCWPNFDQEQIDAVSKVLSSGKVNYWTGEQCRNFEKEYADYCNVRYAIALANGTVALELALSALGIGTGDEVIVTPRTFIASASCAVLRGARPVFADVDLFSQNITVDSIRQVLTKRTKAIVAVHLAGWPCDMDPILELAQQHGLKVIEDCAQAHGASYKGRPVGSIGDIGTFSFCQDKIITTGGEGGMLVTNDRDIWQQAWAYKDHGKSYDAVYNCDHPPGYRWLHESFGTNWRITEMQAAIGRIQLRRLPNWIKNRRRNADILTHYFRRIPALRLTIPDACIGHAYYKYYAFICSEHLKPDWNRDRLIEAIVAKGIPCFSGSCSEIYLEKAFEDSSLRPEQRLPNAKRLGETSLMFLVHPTLSERSMHDIGHMVTKIFESASM